MISLSVCVLLFGPIVRVDSDEFRWNSVYLFYALDTTLN